MELESSSESHYFNVLLFKKEEYQLEAQILSKDKLPRNPFNYDFIGV